MPSPTASDAPAIPFARPDIGPEELAAVATTMSSGWLTSGPAMAAFEQEFKAFLGAAGAADGDAPVEVIAVCSATAGLHLALEALGIGPGDEVIVPTWTFTATAEVIRYLGGTPVIVDVDADTLNISLDAVVRAITPRTKAVIPVHFAGFPVDIAALRAITAPHGILIVEDAAHAFPAGRDGLVVGDCAHSDVAVFSFYATKTLAMGEGGAVVTRRPDIAKRIRVMRSHGIDRDVFDRFTTGVGSWRYDVVAPGFKYNLSDLHASIGRVQLRRANELLARRAEIARRYLAELDGLALQLPAAVPAGVGHAWHLFVVRLLPESALQRDDFIAAMAQAGIGTSVHYRPLHEHSYWRSTLPAGASGPDAFPNAADAATRAVSLPLSSALTDDDVSRITATVRALLS